MSLDPIVSEVGTTYGPERGPGPTQGRPPWKGVPQSWKERWGKLAQNKGPQEATWPRWGSSLGVPGAEGLGNSANWGKGCFQAFTEFRFSFVHRTNTLHHVERIKIEKLTPYQTQAFANPISRGSPGNSLFFPGQEDLSTPFSHSLCQIHWLLPFGGAFASRQLVGDLPRSPHRQPSGRHLGPVTCAQVLRQQPLTCPE